MVRADVASRCGARLLSQRRPLAASSTEQPTHPDVTALTVLKALSAFAQARAGNKSGLDMSMILRGAEHMRIGSVSTS